MNNLFGILGGGNNPMNMVQQFVQFKNAFNGNAQEEVQKLINSGRFTQAQINQAQSMAKALQSMMK